MEERRRYPRLAFNADVDYSVGDSQDNATLSTQSKNLSESGIRIILLEKVDTGKVLDLIFSLPGISEPLKIKGRVVWTEKFTVGDIGQNAAYDTGIEFMDISEDSRNTISRFLRKSAT